MKDYRHFAKSGASRKEWHNGAHKFEHWYRDRTVYLLTARVRGKRPVFLDNGCSAIFWQKFEQYAAEHGFEPWIATLMSNHYHAIGFLNVGQQLGETMRKLHGSVAWMTCKALGIQHKPFWRDDAHRDYFDGCLRDERQLGRAWRSVHQQSIRAKLVKRVEDYVNTRVYVSLDDCMRRAEEQNAYLRDVPYARYAEMRKRGKLVDRST